MITIERWARGAVLALAATLAFASVGCQQTDSEPDDEENVGVAENELDPAGDVEDQGEGGLILPGADAEAGDENKDPQPQPWRDGVTNSSGKPGPGPIDPTLHTASVVSPSGGHH